MSRKPFARPFQKWVAKVVREIRLKGMYDLQQQSRITLDEVKAQLLLVLEAKDANEVELERFREKTYEPAPLLDNVYIAKEASQLNTDKHKIGMTIDGRKREATFNTGSADGVHIVYTRPVSNGKLVEDIAKHALRRYHHAREHYRCKLEHTVDVFDAAGIVVDTLASSYEYIKRSDLFGRMITALQSACDLGEDEGGDRGEEEEVEEANPMSSWFDKVIVRTGDIYDFVCMPEVKKRFYQDAAICARFSVAEFDDYAHSYMTNAARSFSKRAKVRINGRWHDRYTWVAKGLRLA
jgi:hypothetical protein